MSNENIIHTEIRGHVSARLISPSVKKKQSTYR